MKELYEIGIVSRGFTVVSHVFRENPEQKSANKDLRGAFISAINTFAENTFNNNALEYLESKNTLFIFKMGSISPGDSNQVETIILFGLVEQKKKKNQDKLVKKFFEKSIPILTYFTSQFDKKDFSDLTQFEEFSKKIPQFFD